MTEPAEELRGRLWACCGSLQWVEAMAKLWPFDSPQAMAENAALVWRGLAREDWLEAFATHPKIGDGTAAGVAASEQAAVRAASRDELEELARLNREYEARFGYIYIVCASGKSTGQLLDLLRGRLRNDPFEELAIAAEEQLAITQLRLRKLAI